jgi:hypothetical protein
VIGSIDLIFPDDHDALAQAALILVRELLGEHLQLAPTPIASDPVSRQDHHQKRRSSQRLAQLRLELVARSIRLVSRHS